jgi:hypothetical protein
VHAAATTHVHATAATHVHATAATAAHVHAAATMASPLCERGAVGNT